LLVGSHIVEELSAAGWHVRALVRQTPDVGRDRRWDPVAWLREQNVELAAGDILDLPSFIEDARGAEVIFHTAAAVTPPTLRVHPYDAYRIPDVDGTRNAIAAAARSGARLLQLSSVAVYGPKARYASTKATGVDETTPLDPLPERAYYARSKRESEELVMEAHAQGRIWATAVRPAVIYGPRDRQFIPRIARALRLRLAPLIDGGRATMAIVHAAHVADGAVRGANNTRAGGSAYNLANEFDVTWSEFVNFAAAGLGHAVHTVNVPHGIARGGFAIANDRLSRQRIPYAAGCIGVAVLAHEMAVEYAGQRETFGAPLASPQIRPRSASPMPFAGGKTIPVRQPDCHRRDSVAPPPYRSKEPYGFSWRFRGALGLRLRHLRRISGLRAIHLVRRVHLHRGGVRRRGRRSGRGGRCSGSSRGIRLSLVVLCTSRDREYGGDESQALHADLLKRGTIIQMGSALAAAMLGS
jgi:nucleoside-diphosphate-sugar epimerase